MKRCKVSEEMGAVRGCTDCLTNYPVGEKHYCQPFDLRRANREDRAYAVRLEAKLFSAEAALEAEKNLRANAISDCLKAEAQVRELENRAGELLILAERALCFILDGECIDCGWDPEEDEGPHDETCAARGLEVELNRLKKNERPANG